MDTLLEHSSNNCNKNVTLTRFAHFLQYWLTDEIAGEWIFVDFWASAENTATTDQALISCLLTPLRSQSQTVSDE